MGWKGWLLVFVSIIVILVSSVWIGWMLMSKTSDLHSKDTEETKDKEETDDFSKEVVNTPVSDSVIVFNPGMTPFNNGHEFIAYYHNFYNQTLGWGRIESASYERQKETVEEILRVMEQIAEIKNEEIKRDFEDIKDLANIVLKEDNRDAMRKLHRYFHDLDIYFNGYDYNQTFEITTFKGVE